MAINPALARLALTGAAAIAEASQSDEQKEEEKKLSTNVSSSAIAHISWENEVITVVFHRGGTYTYPGSKELYMDFISAPSVGAYFNAHIR